MLSCSAKKKRRTWDAPSTFGEGKNKYYKPKKKGAELMMARHVFPFIFWLFFLTLDHIFFFCFSSFVRVHLKEEKNERVFVLAPLISFIVAVAACSGIQPLWLLYLCIAFGILFLIMLIINVFLCSAMTCSCSKTEVIEKEPSIIEEYDPYRSWHGSQYGSRYVR